MGIYISEFIAMEQFKVPKYTLVYSPQQFTRFSSQGEEMVKGLVDVSPKFHVMFNNIIGQKDQAAILTSCFETMKLEFVKREAAREQKILDNPSLAPNLQFRKEIMEEAAEKEGIKTKAGKPYYMTKRNFKYMVPPSYKRTKSPRISAEGNTLHGMKTDLAGKSIKTLIRNLRDQGQEYSALDIDMSAAHTRFAIAIQGIKNSLLEQTVSNSDHFWDDNAAYYHRFIKEKNIDLSAKQVRKMLKIALYTSLNGGNPFGNALLYKNITGQNPALTLPFKDENEFQQSQLAMDLISIFNRFPLIAEVKELNKACVSPFGLMTHTVDNPKAYELESPHQGISRALQGYEIVLLTVLVQKLLQKGALPINLAHDGTTVIMPGIIDDNQLVKELTEELSEWSSFLLNGLILPVECKFNWHSDNVD